MITSKAISNITNTGKTISFSAVLTTYRLAGIRKNPLLDPSDVIESHLRKAKYLKEGETLGQYDCDKECFPIWVIPELHKKVTRLDKFREKLSKIIRP